MHVCRFASLAVVAALQISCLAPMNAVYFLEMSPLTTEGLHVDPVDDALVFSKEGLQIRVRYLQEEELRREVPGANNPYVLWEPDPRLGYRPIAFTAFQVTVVNPTFAKVLLVPENAFLVTGQGEVMGNYAINRIEARGKARNFETYFLSRGVQTGNEQKLYLERMGKVRETIYHRNSPVFKGNSYTGKILFPPLAPEVGQVELRLYDFVLTFGIHDEPLERISLSFPFQVNQGVRRPARQKGPDAQTGAAGLQQVAERR